MYGSALSSNNAPWLFTEALALLLHLERTGRASRLAGEPERWTLAPAAGSARP